jgi:hypothetical protein
MGEIAGLFLKAGTIKKWDRFAKFQDIGGSDFVRIGAARAESRVTFQAGLGSHTLDSNFLGSGVVHFISHRWLSPTHPDPGGVQLAQLKQGLPDDALVWCDYSCLPQEPRTPSEDEVFRREIDSVPELIKQSWVVVLGTDTDDYDRRAWCQFEAVLALQFNSHPPAKISVDTDQTRGLAEQTNSFIKRSPLYRTLIDCAKALPKDTETVLEEQKEDPYLRGYYVDFPDLSDPAFASFKSVFFQLHASVLADPAVLWEILRRIFPARRESYTYRASA